MGLKKILTVPGGIQKEKTVNGLLQAWLSIY